MAILPLRRVTKKPVEVVKHHTLPLYGTLLMCCFLTYGNAPLEPSPLLKCSLNKSSVPNPCGPALYFLVEYPHLKHISCKSSIICSEVELYRKLSQTVFLLCPSPSHMALISISKYSAGRFFIQAGIDLFGAPWPKCCNINSTNSFDVITN